MSTPRATAKENFRRLKTLIDERQAFEKNNKDPKIDTSSHPTTINFFDLEGKTLLHYAAEAGTLQQVKELIDLGANINLKTLNYGKHPKTPIELALQNGNLEITQYLFEQGAWCINMEAKSIDVPSGCRVWFDQVLKDHKYHDPFGHGITDVERAIEIGDLAFLKQRYLKLSHLHLRTAAANGKGEVVEFLLEQKVALDPETPYSKSALQEAIRYGHADVALVLLKNGVNINWENSDKETALFIAIENGDEQAIKMLLTNGADKFKTDVHGNTILHKAVLTGHLPLLLSLIEENDIASLKSIRNIYGQGYNELQSGMKINQHERVIPRIAYYLHSQYRDTHLLSYDGYCYGLSKLKEYYSGKGKEDYFYNTLDLISNWDGEQNSLDAKLTGIPQADLYKNLHELMEQWINDITWAFGDFTRVPERELQNVYQGKHEWQTAVFVDDPDLNEITLHDVTHDRNKAIFCSKEQLEELLNIFKKMPIGSRFYLNGALHATSGTLNENQSISYYDPNFLSNMPPLDNVNKLANIIIDTKYIWPSERIIAAGEIPFKNGNIPISLRLFCFKKDISQFDYFRVFPIDQLPKSKSEAIKYQENSPNGLNHLHIAVITRSMLSLKDLVTNGYCDINAKDKLLGYTPLYSAVDQGLENMALEMLKFKNIDGINLAKTAKLAYKKKMFDVVNNIINRPDAGDLFGVLQLAIKDDNLELVKVIIESNKVDLTKLKKSMSRDRTNLLFSDASFYDAKKVLDYLDKIGLKADPSRDDPPPRPPIEI